MADRLVVENVYRLSPELLRQIYKLAHKLGADRVVVEEGRWKYAEVTLFEGNNCIEWNIPVAI